MIYRKWVEWSFQLFDFTNSSVHSQLIDVIKVEEEEYKMIQKFEFFA